MQEHYVFRQVCLVGGIDGFHAYKYNFYDSKVGHVPAVFFLSIAVYLKMQGERAGICTGNVYGSHFEKQRNSGFVISL